MASIGSCPTTGTSTGAPRAHGGPSASRSPACCAAVMRGNSNGAASMSPAATGPAASITGEPSPKATTATGHSCTPSAPTSAATDVSGYRLYNDAESPADSATARSWPSIVPASQYTCRYPRSRYRQPVRHGTPVTTSVGVSPRGGGPTCMRAWSSGSYQCTPAGTPMPSGTAAYTSKGKRPPADPAARNNQAAYGRSVVRTTPADRCKRRESWGRSSPVRATSAVPASTATAGAVVDGRFRGRASRGSDWPYRL